MGTEKLNSAEGKSDFVEEYQRDKEDERRDKALDKLLEVVESEKPSGGGSGTNEDPFEFLDGQ